MAGHKGVKRKFKIQNLFESFRWKFLPLNYNFSFSSLSLHIKTNPSRHSFTQRGKTKKPYVLFAVLLNMSQIVRLKNNLLCIPIIIDSNVNASTYRTWMAPHRRKAFDFLNLQFSCNQFGCRISLRSIYKIWFEGDLIEQCLNFMWITHFIWSDDKCSVKFYKIKSFLSRSLTIPFTYETCLVSSVLTCVLRKPAMLHFVFLV